jgi:hypothetical protein
MSSRLNWYPSPSPLQASVVPPTWLIRVSHIHLRGEGEMGGTPFRRPDRHSGTLIVIPFRGEPLPLSELTGGGGKDPSQWPLASKNSGPIPINSLYAIFILACFNFKFLVNILLCHVCRNNYVHFCQKA